MSTLQPSTHLLHPERRLQINRFLPSKCRATDHARYSTSSLPPLIVRCCSPTQNGPGPSVKTEEQGNGASSTPSPPVPAPRKISASNADSSDWIASSLSRRFGIGAGLAWVGLLAFGVISEQIKTRRELFLEEKGTRDVQDAEEVVLGSNVKYLDLRIGGGAVPLPGDLVLIDLVGRVVDGEKFVDTESGSKRSLALVFGRRPYVGGMCAGLEEAMQSMHVGGKRRVVVPANMGFGSLGADLGDGNVVPPNAALEYSVTLLRSSVAPS